MCFIISDIPCVNETFKCQGSENKCVDHTVLCDGKKDCPNGDDEPDICSKFIESIVTL